MILSGISIRLKLLLLTVFTAAVLMVILLTFLDASANVEKETIILAKRSELISDVRSLDRSINRLVLDKHREAIKTGIAQCREIELKLATFGDESEAAEERLLTLKMDQLMTSLDLVVGELNRANSSDSLDHQALLIQMHVLDSLFDEVDRELFQLQENALVKHRRQLVLLIILGIVLLGIYLGFFISSMDISFQKLSAATTQLKEGRLPTPLNLTAGDELQQIGSDLNSHVGDLHKKVNYISALTHDAPAEKYEPGAEDEMGKALVRLSDYLSQKDLEDVSRKREDKRQNWISDGMARMGEVLRSERENVSGLSFAIIQQLVSYMNVEMGALFLTNSSDPAHLKLELSASYAYDRRKYKSLTLEWGTGLPGTCAQEKKKIFLTEVPTDYFEVASASGISRPNCLLLVPMMMDDEVYGVLELATIRLLKPFEIEFVESLADSIASTLLAVRTNERTLEKLLQSQEEAETFKEKEREHSAKLSDLEQVVSTKEEKEAELSALSRALDESLLSAEFGLNGRITGANENYAGIFETTPDQLSGKPYSDFAQVDPYAEEYKAFWADLKAGNSKSGIQAYRLYSGKEIFLQQNFTPVSGADGKIRKILCLAIDITENEKIRQQLENQEKEISRSSLDMRTFQEAVSKALINCELDTTGIILNVNENYAEISGYGRKELLGRNYRLFLKDAEKEQFDRIWDEVEKGKAWEGSVRRSRPTGEEIWIASTFTPVVDSEGSILKVYFMGMDVTEKKLKYQLLEKANREIERLKEKLGNYEA